MLLECNMNIERIWEHVDIYCWTCLRSVKPGQSLGIFKKILHVFKCVLICVDRNIGIVGFNVSFWSPRNKNFAAGFMELTEFLVLELLLIGI